MEISGAQRAALFVHDNEKQKLEIRAENKMNGKISEGYPSKLIEDVFLNNRVYLSSEKERKPDKPEEGMMGRITNQSVLCIPLDHYGNKIGVLYLDNDSTANVFSSEDVELLEVFATQSAIAIENARLYQKSQNLITQVRKLSEEKEEQRVQLLQADKMITLGILASGIAHDIAAPLGAIKNNISFLATYSPVLEQLLDDLSLTSGLEDIGNLPYTLFRDKYKQGITGIQKCVESLVNFLESLRSFYKKTDSTIEDGVDINKVITSSIPLLSHKFSKCGCEPVLVFEESVLPVKGNFQNLQQVVTNLLINACHAVSEKADYQTEKKEITIRTCRDPHDFKATMIIEDNGTGMDESSLKKITLPFFTTRPDEGGTGLGLHITNKIIEQHNGTLSFISEKGKGTVVTVKLPQSGRNGQL
jgi:signal transduction histidine kinase